MSEILINGRTVAVCDGIMLLQAIRASGVELPTLCDDARLKPIGACRLCLVEVDGQSKPVAACTTPVRAGMSVDTHTPALESERRTLLDWLARHYPPAAVGEAPDKPFHRLLKQYGVTARGEAISSKPAPFVDSAHPYMRVDMQRCVYCYRCVHICESVEGRSIWHAVGHGHDTHFTPGTATTLLASGCSSCGACADTCPSGAIEDAAAGRDVQHWTRTVCPYCGVGCELEVGTNDQRIVAARPVLEAPVNRGHLCVKGRYAFDYNHARDRLTTPLIREGRDWKVVDWPTVTGFIAGKLAALRAEYGADALAVLGSSRATNEENYITQKFARMVLGTNNVDSCARVCHTPSAAAMKKMLGTGAATNSFDDIERAALIMICGTNTTENHPVVGARIKQAARRGVPLIVIDPRRIELAEYASLHVPLQPGGNVPFFNAVAQVIIDERLYDAVFVRERIAGFDEFCAHIREWTPERAAPLCGVSAEVIRDTARRYAHAKPVMMLHGLGMTEHVQGTEGVMTLVNLALLTGNLGIAGGGVNPLRGQNNVQGAAHMGCDPGTLTGGLGLNEGREAFARHWGAPLPTTAGLNMLSMMDAAAAGRLKALWCIGYDILHSNANAAATHAALAKLDLLVVQDLFMTETAREYAHVVLPAASSYEKDGTFMNAERRIQRVRRAVTPPGAARSDWEIICDVARALGQGEGFGFNTVHDIWDEIRRVWPQAAGITNARLDRNGLQWPCPDDNHPGTTLLHRDTFSIGPRAELARIDHHASPEQTSNDYPFVLITGRVLAQFNAATMTGRTACNDLRATDTLDLAPDDAARLGITNGMRVRVASHYGEVVLPVRVNAQLKPGECFASFHDPSVMLNRVTSPHRDRYVKAPEYKRTAVRITPA